MKLLKLLFFSFFIFFTKDTMTSEQLVPQGAYEFSKFYKSHDGCYPQVQLTTVKQQYDVLVFGFNKNSTLNVWKGAVKDLSTIIDNLNVLSLNASINNTNQDQSVTAMPTPATIVFKKRHITVLREFAKQDCDEQQLQAFINACNTCKSSSSSSVSDSDSGEKLYDKKPLPPETRFKKLINAVVSKFQIKQAFQQDYKMQEWTVDVQGEVIITPQRETKFRFLDENKKEHVVALNRAVQIGEKFILEVAQSDSDPGQNEQICCFVKRFVSETAGITIVLGYIERAALAASASSVGVWIGSKPHAWNDGAIVAQLTVEGKMITVRELSSESSVSVRLEEDFTFPSEPFYLKFNGYVFKITELNNEPLVTPPTAWSFSRLFVGGGFLLAIAALTWMYQNQFFYSSN